MLSLPVSLLLAVSMYSMRLVLLAFCFVSFIQVGAEVFDINIKGGRELSNLAAIEIELAFEPNSFIVDKDFSINSTNVLFKTVDQTQSILRVFFDASPAESVKEINISGKLTRVNFNGEIKTTIKSLHYISDFAKQVDPSHIKTELVLKPGSDDESIPYLGISSAIILGPSQRMAFNPMLIAIGDIETYGFTLDKSVDQVLINGVRARFVSDKIIAATVEIPAELKDSELAIELLVKVHDTEVRKNLGVIKLVETFN